MSSMATVGDPPWYAAGPEASSFSPASRDSAVMRYKEKKKNRGKFEKKIRYESRKVRADTRKGEGEVRQGRDAYDSTHSTTQRAASDHKRACFMLQRSTMKPEKKRWN
uniref:CCT domain-containing protein n=1 Tax=Ananas comosus var. bracteatus TaxID=296719 RepID=A0A6V7PKR7_ANACO|nr:unnamed protein product [Ananas comosus var. bracteatus]